MLMARCFLRCRWCCVSPWYATLSAMLFADAASSRASATLFVIFIYAFDAFRLPPLMPLYSSIGFDYFAAAFISLAAIFAIDYFFLALPSFSFAAAITMPLADITLMLMLILFYYFDADTPLFICLRTFSYRFRSIFILFLRHYFRHWYLLSLIIFISFIYWCRLLSRLYCHWCYYRAWWH